MTKRATKKTKATENDTPATPHEDRRARLIELSPNYVDVIVQRFESVTGQKSKLVGGAS